MHITNNKRFAIKLEKKTVSPSKLLYEAKLLSYFKNSTAEKDLMTPTIHHFGEEGEYKYLAMNLLGPSLGDLLEYCGGKFSMKTTLMLGE